MRQEGRVEEWRKGMMTIEKRKNLLLNDSAQTSQVALLLTRQITRPLTPLRHETVPVSIRIRGASIGLIGTGGAHPFTFSTSEALAGTTSGDACIPTDDLGTTVTVCKEKRGRGERRIRKKKKSNRMEGDGRGGGTCGREGGGKRRLSGGEGRVGEKWVPRRT